MASIAIQRHWTRLRGAARREGVVLAAFTATLLMSAMLLFSVQPMFAKMVLPKLGGTPAVWAVSMCFFQAALLAGYCYAHLLNRRLSGAWAVLAHLLVLALAYLALPVGLPASFAEPPAGDAYGWLIVLLAAGVGLPFFAVSASAPLLQAWFARTGHAHAADPYFLYGASNLGSLAALLAYPFLIEPAIGLAAQSGHWSRGFVLLGAMIAACGALMLARAATGPSTADSTVTTASEPATPADAAPLAEAPTWAQRSLWVLLALIPSGLMVAVTTYITTDLASAPLLWVIPLALFLATFVLVFRKRPALSYRWTIELFPAAVLAVILLPTMVLGSLAALLAFFAGAIVCHRELYNRRPHARHLTEFYLLMSLGGVLGGIFAALIAPQIFTSTFEFILLLIAALACRPGILLGRSEPLDLKRVAAVVILGLAAMLAYKAAVVFRMIAPDSVMLYVMIAAICLGLFLIRKWPEHRVALVLTMLIAASVAPRDNATVYVERSFFGTHRVTETQDGTMRLLLHGTTVHGAQRLTDAEGRPVTEPTPATYYHPGGPMVRVVDVARTHFAAARPDRDFRVGVVGLGAGSLACQAQPADRWRYFEIDPAVARIAGNPELFGFLSHCLGAPDIVLGDARLTLAKEPDGVMSGSTESGGGFGLIVIDAFSSDAIPVHLLTVEALQLYLDKLDRHGILALHISNRHLDLAPALASTITRIPGLSAVAVFDKQPEGRYDVASSEVVFVAREPAAVAPMLEWAGAKPVVATTARAWTDDYSDVLSAFLRGLVKE